MSRAPTTGRYVALALTLALAVMSTACGKGQDAESGDRAPGVTKDTITLGALVDLTAVFAADSKTVVQGAKLYWDTVNKNGGVCGRRIEVDVANHGYDPQKAVSLYRDMSTKVLAMSPVLGSPIVTALKPSFDRDKMLVSAATWTSQVLPDPNFQIAGATYDLETVNAVDWLTREKGLKRGDALGIVYFEGDYGGNSLKGAKHAAGELGLKLSEHRIQPTDTDLSTQVNAMKTAGVKAIVVAAASPQVASVTTVASSIGLDVPVVGNTPSFSPKLLTTPAGPALTKNFYTVSSIAPAPSATGDEKRFVAAYRAAHTGEQPTQNGVMYAYAAGRIINETLSKACDDLTREGLQKAFRSLTDLDTGGAVAGTLDYSDPSVPPSRQVFVSRAAKDAPGGLTAVGAPFESDLARDYPFDQ
ncbi:ABC transporter substrate-binding protein [Streptomyces sp. MMBL 11-3]|uniref:ABC transporter substrate-binding protein n=1 Tax=Streptomyces sp. MMBL 11-3 TaxID=3382639 RepID=UPI0039B5F788